MNLQELPTPPYGHFWRIGGNAFGVHYVELHKRGWIFSRLISKAYFEEDTEEAVVGTAKYVLQRVAEAHKAKSAHERIEALYGDYGKESK